MPKCKSCAANGTMMRFETYEELDKHFEEVHPKPPPTPCPESMQHVQSLMVEAMLPDWVRNPTELERKIGGPVEAMLREWNTEYVNVMLTALDEADYSIVSWGQGLEMATGSRPVGVRFTTTHQGRSGGLPFRPCARVGMQEIGIRTVLRGSHWPTTPHAICLLGSLEPRIRPRACTSAWKVGLEAAIL